MVRLVAVNETYTSKIKQRGASLHYPGKTVHASMQKDAKSEG